MDKFYLNPEESKLTLDNMEIYKVENLKTE